MKVVSDLNGRARTADYRLACCAATPGRLYKLQS